MIPVVESTIEYNMFTQSMEKLLWKNRLIFVEHGKLVPIYRGKKIHRFLAAGYHLIQPWREKAGSPSHIGFRVANFVFKNIITKDEFQIDLEIRVMYNLKANLAKNPYKACLWSTEVSNTIIGNTIDPFIREAIARIPSRALGHPKSTKKLTEAARKGMRDNNHFGITIFSGPGLSVGQIIYPKGYSESVNMKKQAEVVANMKYEQNMLRTMQDIAITLRSLPVNQVMNGGNALFADILAISHLRDIQGEKDLPQNPFLLPASIYNGHHATNGAPYSNGSSH